MSRTELSLVDWNRALEYAKELCERESKRTGRTIKYARYSVYDGGLGIKILLCDIEGNLFREYPTGTCGTFEAFKRNIDVYVAKAAND